MTDTLVRHTSRLTFDGCTTSQTMAHADVSEMVEHAFHASMRCNRAGLLCHRLILTSRHTAADHSGHHSAACSGPRLRSGKHASSPPGRIRPCLLPPPLPAAAAAAVLWPENGTELFTAA